MASVKVTCKGGAVLRTSLTLKEIGYGRDWDDVEYSDVKQAVAKKLHILVSNIEHASLA